MTIALTVLAGAFAVGWFVPRFLGRVDLRRRDPLLLMVTWLVSMASVLLAATVGVLLLLLPDHGPVAALLAALHHCWAAIQHGSPPRVEAVTGLLGTALLTAFAVRLAIISVRGVRARVARRQENLAVLRLAARPVGGPADILWLAHERPLAFSMAGRPGVVVATEGLVEHLDRAAVAAVLAHERAHLAGRHHLLLATADAMRAAIPFVPLFREAPRALRELAELAADTAAVRQCGPTAVRAALLGVTGHGAPRTSLAMAQDAVDLRLTRLDHELRPAGKLRRTISCGLAGATAAVAPFLTGAVLLLSVAVISCPLNG
jgi:hypothetical protein